MRAAKLVHELLPERGAALFEQLGANAQRAGRGPVTKSPAAELREHGYELDRGRAGSLTILRALNRYSCHQRIVDLFVTNVPGPQRPLYLLGARLLEVFPVVQVAGNVPLSVAVLSYAGQRARYSLTDPAIQLVPVFAQLGSWGLRHRPTSRALRVRAELLEQGGPALWQEFMDELRRSHLGSESPARSPSVRERLNAAFLAAINSS